MARLIEEQVVIGRDSLDDLNSEVNTYIQNGYQPKDPMLINPHSDDMKNHYRYMQTMVQYTSDLAPDDLGAWVVDWFRRSGAEAVLESITDDQWKEFWARVKKTWDEMEDDGPPIVP